MAREISFEASVTMDAVVVDVEAASPSPAQPAEKQCVSVGAARSCNGEGCCDCVDVKGFCVPVETAKLLLTASGESADTDDQEEIERVKLLRALAAEAIGTAMMIVIGCGSVCSSLSEAYQGIWQVAVVWGIGVALSIYSTADISGAHLNPAITLAFYLVRPEAHGMTVKKSLLYVVAQMAGAIGGAAINLAVHSNTIEAFERKNNIVRGEPNSILSALAFGEYFPNPGLSKQYGGSHYLVEDVSVLKALAVEAWGTFLLALVIFGLTNKYNKVGLGAGVPFMIGMTVSINLALYAPITQAGWNPARDFGPRLVAYFGGWGEVAIPGPRNGFWIYIVGPFIGAPIGAALAELLLWRRYASAPL